MKSAPARRRRQGRPPRRGSCRAGGWPLRDARARGSDVVDRKVAICQLGRLQALPSTSLGPQHCSVAVPRPTHVQEVLTRGMQRRARVDLNEDRKEVSSVSIKDAEGRPRSLALSMCTALQELG